MTLAPTADRSKTISRLLCVLIALYAVARLLSVFPNRVPMLAIVALQVLVPLTFAVIHGAVTYSPRAVLTFVAVCIVIGNTVENIGVRTGFPYGHYYFTHLMGPRILSVPIFLGLAYVGMAYLSWILASLILDGALAGTRMVTVPILATAIMLAWDLSSDPVWSTVLHAWMWRDGGRYFGVPLTNFAGWILTNFVIYQLFAFYVRSQPISTQPAIPHPNLALLFYALCAAANILILIPLAGLPDISDPSGTQWRARSIGIDSALVSILVMGSFALLAWRRSSLQHGNSPYHSGTPSLDGSIAEPLS
jgi:uncharacterized membrane protein